MRIERLRHVLVAFCVVMAGSLLWGCAQKGGEAEKPAVSQKRSVLVYSGRNEKLVGSLLKRFQEASGIEIEVRYASTPELAATLIEEGGHTPADVFLSQDAAALGALSRDGLLRKLPESALARVPARFVSPRRDWVGLSGRVRTVVYNTKRVRPEDLPQSLEETSAPRYRGRFGIAPANASFEAHMAVYDALHGKEALRKLLSGIAANEPRDYPKNSAIVTAVLAGEIDWGLVNHYYLWRALQQDPSAPGANFVMPKGEASSFVNVAGAGILHDTKEARALVEFLLSDEAQRYFAEETFEYPLVPDVPAHAGLPPLDSIATPDVDFGDVSAVLEETLVLIQETGLLP